jgi:hypothetical protein
MIAYSYPIPFPDGPPLVVVETGANRLVYINVGTGSRTYSTEPLSGPRGLTGVTVFQTPPYSSTRPVVADYGNNLAKRIDPSQTYSISLFQPTAVANNGTHLFITYGSAGSGWVHERSFDLQTYYGSFNVGGTPVAILKDGTNDCFYITDDSTNTVRVFNNTLTSQIRSWTLPGDPGGIACDQNGFVYVAVKGANRIQKYSFDGRLVTEMILSTGFAPTGLYISGMAMLVTVQNISNPTGGYVTWYNW